MTRQYAFHAIGEATNSQEYEGLRHPVELIPRLIKDPAGWQVETCWYNLSSHRDFIYTETLMDPLWKDDHKYTWIPVADLTWQDVMVHYDMSRIIGNDPKSADIFGWTMRFKDPNGDIWFMPAFDGSNKLGGLPRIMVQPTETCNTVAWMGLGEPIWAITDSSAHLYFVKLLPYDRFMEFMGAILMLHGDLVDTKWVAASLVRRRGVLRLTPKSGHLSKWPHILNPWAKGNSEPFPAATPFPEGSDAEPFGPPSTFLEEVTIQ